MDGIGSEMERLRIWRAVAASLTLCGLVALGPASVEPTVDEMKARVAGASVADRPPLCLHICERQLQASNRFYVAGDSEKAQGAMADVVSFAKIAGDSAIQSRKHEKQSEIAIRKIIRKLEDLKHTVSHEDQGEIQNSIDRLQRIRDDLLAAMFPKGVKK